MAEAEGVDKVNAQVRGGHRLTSANAAPMDGCDHGLRALEGNRRGRVRADSGEVGRRDALPGSQSHLLNDTEGLLVTGDKITEVPADAGHILFEGLKEVCTQVHEVNTWWGR